MYVDVLFYLDSISISVEDWLFFLVFEIEFYSYIYGYKYWRGVWVNRLKRFSCMQWWSLLGHLEVLVECFSNWNLCLWSVPQWVVKRLHTVFSCFIAFSRLLLLVLHESLNSVLVLHKSLNFFLYWTVVSMTQVQILVGIHLIWMWYGICK